MHRIVSEQHDILQASLYPLCNSWLERNINRCQSYWKKVVELESPVRLWTVDLSEIVNIISAIAILSISKWEEQFLTPSHLPSFQYPPPICSHSHLNNVSMLSKTVVLNLNIHLQWRLQWGKGEYLKQKMLLKNCAIFQGCIN